MRPSSTVALVAAASLTTVMAAGTPAIAGSHDNVRVVHPGQSIQAAVDKSTPGGTVVVKEGTYHQAVVIQTNGLTLRAVGKVVLKPTKKAGLCDMGPERDGICVVPRSIDQNGQYKHRVVGVTVTGFRVVGFSGFGVFGYGTRNFSVSDVQAYRNGAYGVANFDGVGTSFTHNRAAGSEEAGIYVGDSPHANAVVEDNKVWANGFGIFVRHVHGATVHDNAAWGNCVGVFLLDEGQQGGNGDNHVTGNAVTENNKFCPAIDDPDEGHIPAFSGSGILLFGSVHNVVAGNVVKENRHHSGARRAGGIVLVKSPFSGIGANGNLVTHNVAFKNTPADIREDKASRTNTIVRNHCGTSIPGGFCHHGD